MKSEITENIELWSGGFIPAYPIDEDTLIDVGANDSGLDNTGHFLSIRRKPSPIPRSEEQLKQEKLFTDNAFLLLANCKKILSDSRMFLAPAYISNGLAYTGYLPTATVGTYIELWLNCPASVIFGEDDMMSLIWHISGSPLSGANSCSAVSLDGTLHGQQVGQFYKLWTKFAEIASYYGDAMKKYEALTLDEVVEILKEETTEEEYRRNLEQVCNFIKHSIHKKVQ